jgi:dethiobiotin synthetase
MERGYFITGTDTDVGKTWATIALMRYFKQQGKTVVGMKPVAAGCTFQYAATNSNPVPPFEKGGLGGIFSNIRYPSNPPRPPFFKGGSPSLGLVHKNEYPARKHQDGQLKNADALLIQENASVKLDYDLINPYAYALPVSPHIAGIDNPVNLALLVERFNALKTQAEIVVVEGAGGWYTPLNDTEDISDLAKALALPVILVVAIRLGCINHAKLTYQAIQHSSLPCVGWIAVCVDPALLNRDENIQTIKTALSAPLLGVFSYMDNADFDLLAGRLVL